MIRPISVSRNFFRRGSIRGNVRRTDGENQLEILASVKSHRSGDSSGGRAGPATGGAWPDRSRRRRRSPRRCDSNPPTSPSEQSIMAEAARSRASSRPRASWGFGSRKALRQKSVFRSSPGRAPSCRGAIPGGRRRGARDENAVSRTGAVPEDGAAGLADDGHRDHHLPGLRQVAADQATSAAFAASLSPLK